MADAASSDLPLYEYLRRNARISLGTVTTWRPAKYLGGCGLFHHCQLPARARCCAVY